MSTPQIKADHRFAWLGALLMAVVAAGCGSATGPAPDRMVEKREQFTREAGPEKQWREMEVALPAYPDEAYLTKVQLSGPASFAFLVDTRSIDIGEDGVVRYTLVARSPSGTDNVSFEGMRCETLEHKTYAIGSLEGEWSALASSEWNVIRKKSTNDYRYNLYRYYFCPNGVPQRTANKAIAALKGGLPHPEGR